MGKKIRMDNSPLEECVQGWTRVVLMYLGGRRETGLKHTEAPEGGSEREAEGRVFTLQFNNNWELELSSPVIFLVSKRLKISSCLE